MNKYDFESRSLAKAQMNDAYKAGKRSRCKYSKLTIEGKPTPITGVISSEERIFTYNELAKIPLDLPSRPKERQQ